MTDENRLKIEGFILGSYAEDKDLFDDCESKVSATLFSNHNQNIYSIISDFHKMGVKPNIILISNKLNEIGYKNGASLAVGLGYDPAIASNITYYVNELWTYNKNNELLNVCSDIAITGNAPLETSVEKLKNFMIDLDYQQNNIGQEYSIGDAFKELEADLDKIEEDDTVRLSTGSKDLDKKIGGGLKAPYMYCIGARPGMGKTTKLIQIIRANYAKPNTKILFFSAEMQAMDVVRNMASAEHDIDNEKLISNKKSLTQFERDKIKSLAKKVIEFGSLIVDPTPKPTYQYIGAKVRKYRKKYPNDEIIVLIDYLQIMGMKAEEMRGRNREEQLTLICDSLPAIGKENRVPIVLLSQLGREVEKRSPPIPIPSDLKGSGSIEANSAFIIFIYRPEYYKIFQDGKGRDMKGMAKFIIAKNRYGPLASVYTQFYGQFCRFSEYNQTTENSDPNQTSIITGENNDQPSF